MHNEEGDWSPRPTKGNVQAETLTRFEQKKRKRHKEAESVRVNWKTSSRVSCPGSEQ